MKAQIKQMVCSRCILDTTVREIEFDESGICNYCRLNNALEKEYPLGKKGKKIFNVIIQKIKKSGKKNKYDCIVGVSGGTDSSYTLYQAIKAGLRPLAVHFDNGWNSETAVSNIQKICKKLDVDLYTYVVDWEEFKDLQISFLKASVSDAEIPTDIGILGTLFQVARQEKVKYILNGHSFRTEGIAPVGWTYMDGEYIISVQKRFGNVPLKTFPNYTLCDFIFYTFIKRLKVIPFLNYFLYEKAKARKILTEQLDWKYYGGHHHESIYTKFIQSYYLPQKFNIDKRKRELSAQIRSGALSRKEALKKIKKPYPYRKDNVNYVLSKLDLTVEQFEQIMNAENRTFLDYPTYYPLFKTLRFPLKIAYQLNLVPKLLYLKYVTIL